LDTQDQIIPSDDEKPVDRKDLLAQQFDDIEADDNDPKDRFSKAYNKPVTPEAKEAVEAAPDAEEPVWKRPPSSWKRDFHEVWQTADPRLQEYAYKREEEMRAGIEPLRSKAQFADQMNEAIQPYMNTIQGLGIDAPRAVKALMEADHALRYSAPEQKRAYLANLARSYGIDLGDMGGASQGGPIDPNYYALQNELNSVRGEISGFKQQQEQAENQSLLGEINNFAGKAEYFEEARPVMIQLLQSGVAGTLEDAYEKAIRLNDDIFQQTQQRSQAEAAAQKSSSANRAAKAAKAAAVSVKSSTPGAKTSTKAQDRRSMLLEQFDSVNERF
jgi:hypothetical protein